MGIRLVQSPQSRVNFTDLVVKNEVTPEQFIASIAEGIYDQSKITGESQKGKMAFVDAELMDISQTC